MTHRQMKKPAPGGSGAMSSVLATEADLATRANQLHEMALDAGKQTLEYAFECGRVLAEVKDSLGHGEWVPWVKENFRGSTRTAQRYLRLAANATTVSHLEAETLSEALAALATPKSPPKPKKNPDLVAPRTPEQPLASRYAGHVVDAEIVESPFVVDAEIVEPSLVVDMVKDGPPTAVAGVTAPENGIAVDLAEQAIRLLDEIKNDDPEIRKAIERIITYCWTRKNELVTGKDFR